MQELCKKEGDEQNDAIDDDDDDVVRLNTSTNELTVSMLVHSDLWSVPVGTRMSSAYASAD